MTVSDTVVMEGGLRYKKIITTKLCLMEQEKLKKLRNVWIVKLTIGYNLIRLF